MRFAKAFAALALMAAMAGNPAAAASCAELCAREPHHSEEQPAQPAAAAHHSAHAMSMGSHLHAPPEAPASASVERQACSGHVPDAVTKGPAANSPRANATGVVAQSAVESAGEGISSEEIAASPPPSPHLLPALPLRI